MIVNERDRDDTDSVVNVILSEILIFWYVAAIMSCVIGLHSCYAHVPGGKQARAHENTISRLWNIVMLVY